MTKIVVLGVIGWFYLYWLIIAPRYTIYLTVYGVALAFAALITPLLPLFATVRAGGINNDERQGSGIRLPTWLSWFDTPDNALTGDEAHAKRHANVESWWSMVCWLYRNPLYGFKWSVLGYPVEEPELVVKREEGYYKYFDAFQWRKPWLGKNRTFGWILDAYYHRDNTQPKAIFVFWN